MTTTAMTDPKESSAPNPALSQAKSESPRPTISICIPAYNEAENLPAVLDEALETLDAIPGWHEIVVVDDGSKDDTWPLLEEKAVADDRVRPVRHDKNRGLAAALESAIAAANGEYIFLISADRQCSMNELIAMYARAQDGFDVVVGARRTKQYTPWRKLVSGSFNFFVFLLWGKHFGDIGFCQLARASLWQRIPITTQSAFAQAERLIIAHGNGAKITHVPVDHHDRQAGTSSFASPMTAVQAFIDMLGFRLSKRGRLKINADWKRLRP